MALLPCLQMTSFLSPSGPHIFFCHRCSRNHMQEASHCTLLIALCLEEGSSSLMQA